MTHGSAYKTAYPALQKIFFRMPEHTAPGGLYDRISGTFKDSYWNDIYSILLSCGAAQDPQHLLVEFIDKVQHLCPFDQATVYFRDGNAKYSGQYVVNVDERWISMYLSYYSTTENHRYDCFLNPNSMEYKELLSYSSYGLLDWEQEEPTEFLFNYIRPRGLKYTFSFPLYDLNNNQRSIVMLDRVSGACFRDEELATMYLLIPQLNSLHRNFYYQGFNMNDIKNATWNATCLTARESEIASMLCQGVTTANISRTLCISLSTTYKHIAHIYEKLNISSRQELLVRLLGKSTAS